MLLSLFGVLSLFVPYEMSNFTYSLGLYTLSGDYAYQEYERSGDINYLARSFEIAYRHGSARKAETRFDCLVAHEGFSDYCAAIDAAEEDTIRSEDFFYGMGACVKYRLAKTEEEKRAVCAFAMEHTADSFPSGNPMMALSVEGANKQDEAFCSLLLSALQGERSFEENEYYTNIVKFLKASESKEDSQNE